MKLISYGNKDRRRHWTFVGLNKTDSSVQCVNEACNGGKLAWWDGSEFAYAQDVHDTVDLNRGNEDCLALFVSGSGNSYEIKDIKCDSSPAYLCYRQY